ncbi:WXG100 family type VII secretion target [Nocardia pneumoniae]|uniref:WXG100 family type VII secretion target n=1 Tax=Nocardia pneumoniae TaxID=228601 RepID=UPI000592A874|nr:WXG100 family type VII secretion target [Nocardia pneumoniae]
MSEEPSASASLSVIPENVKEFGRYVYGIATELRSGTVSLDVEVNGLMSAWEGAAADAYLAGWNEMRGGAVEVWEALFELAEKLGITAETYRVVDAGTAPGFSSLDL